MNLNQYVEELNRQYQTGIAREHSYRPALKDYLQSLLPKLVVTNEPAHIECGAPDYIISREKDHLPIFFVEAKDVGDSDLDGKNDKGHKEQFNRYKAALDYILFTDYLDFRLYEHGEFVDSVRIAEVRGKEIVIVPKAEEKFVGIIRHLGDSAIQSIGSATQLAKLMASKARLLANIIEKALDDDVQSYDNDNLQGQYSAFKNVLIQDLTQKDFADIYAQTIAYGMFAARLHDKTPQDFSREEAAYLIPKTNPFLRQIFNNLAGSDLDGRIAWVVDDLVTVFRVTNIERIMKNYKSSRRHHDPMIHFYEDFLTEYNPKQRKLKGVWYTPQPIVGFIVRAVDEILQKEFGLPEGLADYSMIEHKVSIEQSRDKRTSDGLKHTKQRIHRVQILDPATGTGTFLAEVVNQIYDRYRENQGVWQQYVEQHLLPRLNGFEILMASYAVAHLKLDMLLNETGYQHKTDRRLHIYLTNSLEESNEEPRTLFAQWLSREATEANSIKRDCPVMVMVGNPPYNGESPNKGTWIKKLIGDYKKEPGGKVELQEKNSKWINDDYVKFIRLAQDYIDKKGTGIVAYINPHGFLDNPTFRGMRWSLLRTYDKIFVLDLHGNSKKKEINPNGGKEENVFDIMQGVSINFFIKTGKKQLNELGKVFYKDIYGSRKEKYDFLDNENIETVGYKEVKLQSPMYFFKPIYFQENDEYEKGFKLNELVCNYSMGITTGRDSLNVCHSSVEAERMIDDIQNMPLEDFRNKYKVGKDSTDWTLENAKNDVVKNIRKLQISDYFYRPFDNRFIPYTGESNGIIVRPRYDVAKNMIANNLSLCTIKVGTNYNFDVLVTTGLTDKTLLSSKDNTSVFPLYEIRDGESILNLREKVLRGIEDILDEKVDPKELFDYIYAILHSPNYRERYKEFLKIDFPRIPYPTDKEAYHYLVKKGEELRNLHLMEGLPNQTGIVFPIVGSCQVDCCSWKNNRVYINNEQYFEGVSENTWNFYIGSYQPAQKWLKDRKGCMLSFEDVRHYSRIIYVLKNTGKIMNEIDSL